MQLIGGKKKVNQNCLQTKKKSFLHISHMHSHSLPFPPISLKSRMHACSFLCCEGSKMCLIMARTFSYRHSLDCAKVLLSKQEDINPKYLPHYSLDKIKIYFCCFISGFLSAAVPTLPLLGNWHFLKGHLTQSKTQQVAGPLTESCKELSHFSRLLYLYVFLVLNDIFQFAITCFSESLGYKADMVEILALHQGF